MLLFGIFAGVVFWFAVRKRTGHDVGSAVSLTKFALPLCVAAISAGFLFAIGSRDAAQSWADWAAETAVQSGAGTIIGMVASAFIDQGLEAIWTTVSNLFSDWR